MRSESAQKLNASPDLSSAKRPEDLGLKPPTPSKDKKRYSWLVQCVHNGKAERLLIRELTVRDAFDWLNEAVKTGKLRIVAAPEAVGKSGGPTPEEIQKSMAEATAVIAECTDKLRTSRIESRRLSSIEPKEVRQKEFRRTIAVCMLCLGFLGIFFGPSLLGNLGEYGSGFAVVLVMCLLFGAIAVGS